MFSLEHFILFSSAIIACQGISSTHQNKKGSCKAPVLENGRHMPNKVFFEVGEWLQYHCDEGYMTAERNIVENVQCLSSGWSAVPQCSGIFCSFQPKTGLDKLHLVYSSGPVAKFSCNEGFILKGSEISQCYYYGWDPPLPTCQDSGERVKCPPPPQPMNTQVIKLKSVYFSGDKEIMKCKPGFQLHGAQMVFCKSGQWTSPPQCVRLNECDDPPSVLSGTLDSASVKPKYHSGTVVMYKCNNGFEITGLKEIVCINGKWSLPPTCISSLNECDDPPSVLSGTLDSASVKPKYHSGSVVMYKCNNGFEITGLKEIVCINGKWSLPPTCISNGCTLSKDAMLTNGIALENSPVNISEGESVEFHCIGNMVPIQSLTFTVTCKDGKIHYPQCINPDSDYCQLSVDKIEQNNLVLPKSTSIGKAYSNGDKIPARCKTNYYRASSSLIVECLNGKMVYPKCTQEKPCRINQDLLDDNFLEFDPNYDYKVYVEDGEIIHFMCKAGYTTVTETTGLCIKEDIIYPICHEI